MDNCFWSFRLGSTDWKVAFQSWSKWYWMNISTIVLIFKTIKNENGGNRKIPGFVHSGTYSGIASRQVGIWSSFAFV